MVKPMDTNDEVRNPGIVHIDEPELWLSLPNLLSKGTIRITGSTELLTFTPQQALLGMQWGPSQL